jgi:hypothetical protein
VNINIHFWGAVAGAMTGMEQLNSRYGFSLGAHNKVVKAEHYY